MLGVLTQEQIAKELDRARASGFLTHAFCAYGLLSESQPRIMAGSMADGRSVFDLASLTKALVTAPLLLARLAEQGLDLTAAVFDLAPTLKDSLHPEFGRLSCGALLGHRSGLPPWRNFWINRLDADYPLRLDRESRRSLVVETLNRLLWRRPETIRQTYSDVGFILLGQALEDAAHRSLAEQLAAWEFNDPIAFGPRDASSAIPTGYCMLRQRPLIGEVHDENCAALGGVAGHAGVFGTGLQLVEHLRQLARSPFGQQLIEINGRAVKRPPEGAEDSLWGWFQGNGPASSPFGSGLAIGHLGFTGTSFFILPESEEYAVFLTNRVISGRVNPRAIATLRQTIMSLLARCR